MTQIGRIHAWDLRSSSEPWALTIPPELGTVSAIALGPDKNWLCYGTSRGYVGVC
jgi:hypothetical protein